MSCGMLYYMYNVYSVECRVKNLIIYTFKIYIHKCYMHVLYIYGYYCIYCTTMAHLDFFKIRPIL